MGSCVVPRFLKIAAEATFRQKSSPGMAGVQDPRATNFLLDLLTVACIGVILWVALRFLGLV